MGDLNARAENEDGLHEKLGKELNHLLPDIEATTLETGSRCQSKYLRKKLVSDL